MNNREIQLYNELRETAKECDDLMNLIYERALPDKELKKQYKELKNRCKNRLREIKLMGKPFDVDSRIYSRYLRNYEEAMAWGFIEPTNGNLDKMVHALEEASYKFTKFLENWKKHPMKVSKGWMTKKHLNLTSIQLNKESTFLKEIKSNVLLSEKLSFYSKKLIFC